MDTTVKLDTRFADRVTSAHDRTRIRLFPHMAVYFAQNISDVPDAITWVPPDWMNPVGWLGDDGATLSYTPGEVTVIRRLDGGDGARVRAPGSWSLKIHALEIDGTMAGLWLGQDLLESGGWSDGTAAGTIPAVILAGIDTRMRPIIVVMHDAEPSAWEDMTLSGTKAACTRLTFTTRTAGRQLDIYGLETGKITAPTSQSYDGIRIGPMTRIATRAVTDKRHATAAGATAICTVGSRTTDGTPTTPTTTTTSMEAQ